MVTIGNCIWFDGQAQEAAEFYTSIIPNSRITRVTDYPASSPSNKPVGSVLTVEFELDGHAYMGLNGGPDFPQSEAFSIMVRAQSQEESDHYWSALLEGGGQESMCGWLKDRYGVSWQVYPAELDDLMAHEDREVARRAMEVMLTQRKIELEPILAAARGE